jgi:hypothetical protein
VCIPISSLRTPEPLGVDLSAATITRQAALRNSSRSVALRVPLFARGTYPSYGAPHGGSGSPKPRLWPLYIVAALAEGDKRAYLVRSSSRIFLTCSSILECLPGALCLAAGILPFGPWRRNA